MKSYDELMKMSYKELKQEVLKNVEEMKQDHDTAVLMGSLGVSPKHMNMYFDSMKSIRE